MNIANVNTGTEGLNMRKAEIGEGGEMQRGERIALALQTQMRLHGARGAAVGHRADVGGEAAAWLIKSQLALPAATPGSVILSPQRLAVLRMKKPLSDVYISDDKSGLQIWVADRGYLLTLLTEEDIPALLSAAVTAWREVRDAPAPASRRRKEDALLAYAASVGISPFRAEGRVAVACYREDLRRDKAGPMMEAEDSCEFQAPLEAQQVREKEVVEMGMGNGAKTGTTTSPVLYGQEVFEAADPGTWYGALPEGYAWREHDAKTGEYRLYAADGTDLTAAYLKTARDTRYARQIRCGAPVEREGEDGRTYRLTDSDGAPVVYGHMYADSDGSHFAIYCEPGVPGYLVQATWHGCVPSYVDIEEVMPSWQYVPVATAEVPAVAVEAAGMGDGSRAVEYYVVIVRGEQPGSLGEDFASSGIQNDPEIIDWLAANGSTADDPDVWALVTRDDEPEGELRDVIARQTFIRGVVAGDVDVIEIAEDNSDYVTDGDVPVGQFAVQEKGICQGIFDDLPAATAYIAAQLGAPVDLIEAANYFAGRRWVIGGSQ